MKTPYKHNGVVAGELSGSTFFRKVNPADQLVKNHQGYALHETLLDELLDLGIDTIVLQEPTRRLTSDIEDWQTLSHEYYGYRVLPTSHMSVG